MALKHVGDRDLESGRRLAQRHDLVATGECLGERGDRLGGRDDQAQVDDRQVQLAGERLDQLALGDRTGLDQLGAEPEPGDDLLGEGEVERFRSDHAGCHQHVAEAKCGNRIGRCAERDR